MVTKELILIVFREVTSETESLFNYTGRNDTVEVHNPTNKSEPPFFEESVSAQRNNSNFDTRVATCTNNDVLSRTCLYDFLMTDNENMAMATMAIEETLTQVTSIIG